MRVRSIVVESRSMWPTIGLILIGLMCSINTWGCTSEVADLPYNAVAYTSTSLCAHVSRLRWPLAFGSHEGTDDRGWKPDGFDRHHEVALILAQRQMRLQPSVAAASDCAPQSHH